MQHMFALDDAQTPVAPNEREGRFLMREIMLAGNFGHHDTRYKATSRGINSARMRDISKRLFVLLKHYPGETLWDPFLKVWHLFWRMLH